MLQNEVVGVGVGRLALLVSSARDLAVDLVALLVDGEVALVGVFDRDVLEVEPVVLGVEGQFAEVVLDLALVLLFEDAGVLALGVVAVVVAVLDDLVDEVFGVEDAGVDDGSDAWRPR